MYGIGLMVNNKHGKVTASKFFNYYLIVKIQAAADKIKNFH